jgi:hypothetical protein
MHPQDRNAVKDADRALWREPAAPEWSPRNSLYSSARRQGDTA